MDSSDLINRNTLRIGLFAFFTTILAMAVFLAGFYLGNTQAGKTAQDFSLVSQTYDILARHALDPMPDAVKMEYAMIRGLLQAYGEPHTSFHEPPQHELQSNRLEGRFGGIGVRIQRDSEQNFRLYPLRDSPAAESGILDGDQLIQVDDLLISPQTNDEQVQSALRGPVGSSVKIVIFRLDKNEILEFSLKRAEISLPSVVWNLLPEDERIGLVRVNVIAATTADEIRTAVNSLKAAGMELLVLDLRDNSGGLVDAGIEISRLFLKAGDTILEQQYRDQAVQSFKAITDGEFQSQPLVVLINHGTASAAEIVAGSLKTTHQAALIGATSFGKDTIQLVFELSDGSSLHVTAARWWIPGLEPPVRDHGIQPDYVIEAQAEENLESRYILKILELSRQYLN